MPYTPGVDPWRTPGWTAQQAGDPVSTDSINVQDYVDFSTDAVTRAAQINAAMVLASTQGKLLAGFKGRTYEIGASLLLPSGLNVDFEDALFTRTLGTGAFDMIRNSDLVGGNSDIRIYRPRIDGRYTADGLNPAIASNRFCGIRFKNVLGGRILDPEITGTCHGELQAEGNRASIILDTCTTVSIRDPQTHDNHGTGIVFYATTRCQVRGGNSEHDGGSGFSSNLTVDCAVTDYTSYYCGALASAANPGATYTGISLNGIRFQGANLKSIGSTGSGVDLGHPTLDTSDSVVTGVEVHANQTYGLSIYGAPTKGIHVSGINAGGNGTAGGARSNITVFSGATEIHLSHIRSHDSATAQGIYFGSGTGHTLQDAHVTGNYASGVYVDNGVGVSMKTVRSWDNGKGVSANTAGVILSVSAPCDLEDVKCWDSLGASGTQESGLWIGGGSGHKIRNSDFTGNKTNTIRQTSSPTSLTFRDCLPTTYNTPSVPVDVQEFSTAGTFTWTKPTWASAVRWEIVDGGAGGGSGARRAAGVVACGGGAGASSPMSFGSCAASALGATATVVVGAGGAGGAAVTTDDTNGNAGSSGGASSFNSWTAPGVPGGGAGGTTTTGTGGTTGTGMVAGSSGALASTTGLVGSQPSSNGFAGAGGSGGGVSAADVAAAGGAGGVGRSGNANAATAGTAAGGNGSPGGTNSAGLGGGGGAGGGGNATGAGGTGGVGGNAGGGGGGGGGSRNGNASGAGGAGGFGFVRVVSS